MGKSYENWFATTTLLKEGDWSLTQSKPSEVVSINEINKSQIQHNKRRNRKKGILPCRVISGRYREWKTEGLSSGVCSCGEVIPKTIMALWMMHNGIV